MNTELLKKNLRVVPDFPKPGIQFWDITTLLKNPVCMKEVDDALYELYKDKGITKVVGIESRGFFFATSLALRLGAGFVPIRKHRKLPAETLSVSYEKEYGDDTIEVHKDAICGDDVVLVHDDILATGGSSAAAIKLISQLSPAKIYFNVLFELGDLDGRSKLPPGVEVSSLMVL